MLPHLIYLLGLGVSLATAEAEPLPTSDVAPTHSTRIDVDALVRRAHVERLAEEREWHLLLHYVPVLGGVESEADGDGFFFADDGKENPASELEANLRAFFAPKSGQPDGYPECRFPARYAWLAERLDFASLGVSAPSCPSYEQWLRVMNAGSATLVFASAYINAPASMFGHTLLRINRRDFPDKPLLAHAVNFAGVPTTTNPVLYTLMGLTGGFRGIFQALPYYLKVQEYGNFESRDLWEYDLALTEPELTRLLRHIFEMEQTHFDYFYLDENCSYHLLSLLEVARPSLHMRDPSAVWVVPSDTLRAVLETDLVAARRFRPSATTVMRQRYRSLSSHEADLAEELALEEAPDFAPLRVLSSERQAAVLDASHDYLKYVYRYTLNVDTPEQRWANARELQLLRERSKLGVTTGVPEVPEPAAPEDSHDTGRFFVAGAVNGAGRPFALVSLRTALHDLLDAQRGYNPDSQIKLSEFRLRIAPHWLERKGRELDAVLIDRIDAIDVLSIQPKDGVIVQSSWRVNFGGGRVRDLGCQRWRCSAVDLSVGRGFALGGTLLTRFTLYGFIDALASVGPAFAPNYRLGAGPSLGLILGTGAPLRLLGEGRLRYDALGDTRVGRWVPQVDAGASLTLSKDLALRATYALARESREAALGLHYYY